MNSDRISETYATLNSLRATAQELGISASKIKKTLVSRGEYRNDTMIQVAELYNDGLAPAEIAEKLKLSISCVNQYLPYQRAAQGYGGG